MNCFTISLRFYIFYKISENTFLLFNIDCLFKTTPYSFENTSNQLVGSTPNIVSNRYYKLNNNTSNDYLLLNCIVSNIDRLSNSIVHYSDILLSKFPLSPTIWFSHINDIAFNYHSYFIIIFSSESFFLSHYCIYWCHYLYLKYVNILSEILFTFQSYRLLLMS